jgi:hypothetical protein
MAISVTGTMKPQGKFPIAEAVDIEMPDGTRLSEVPFGSYKIADGTEAIEPGTYYTFGEVDSLAITLVESDTSVANEFCFEFIPSENFTGMIITPEPKWVIDPQFPAGKTCQVSILRGIGVIVYA